MTDEEMESATIAYYSNHADHFLRHVEGHGLPVGIEQMLRVLLRSTDREPLLLDVGCGSGRLLPEFRELGLKRYIGFDPSPALIEVARARYPDADFRIGSVHALPDIVSEECDLFVVESSLMHIPRDRMTHALAQIRAVMQPSGIGIVTVPYGDEADLFTSATSTLLPAGAELFVCAWTPEAFTPLAEAAGFEVVRCSDDFTMLDIVLRVK